MFKIKVKPDGGESFEVETTSRDIVRWEAGGNRQNPRSMSSLAENLKMSDVTDLAWFAAERRGLTTLDSRQWRSQVDVDITSTKDEDATVECPNCGHAVPLAADDDTDDDGPEVGPT